MITFSLGLMHLLKPMDHFLLLGTVGTLHTASPPPPPPPPPPLLANIKTCVTYTIQNNEPITFTVRLLVRHICSRHQLPQFSLLQIPNEFTPLILHCNGRIKGSGFGSVKVCGHLNPFSAPHSLYFWIRHHWDMHTQSFKTASRQKDIQASYSKFSTGTHTRLPIKVTRWTFTSQTRTVEGNAQLTHTLLQEICLTPIQDSKGYANIDISKSSVSCLGAIKRNYRIFDSNSLLAYEKHILSLPSAVCALKLDCNKIILPSHEKFFTEMARSNLEGTYSKLYIVFPAGLSKGLCPAGLSKHL